jgi:AraC-like DNA-binding protein
MHDFYKRAFVALACLAAASIIAGYACVKASYLQLRLLSEAGKAVPWRVETSSDASQGGESTIRMLQLQSTLGFQFNIAKSARHPYASTALVFEDANGKPAFADLSRYTSISFNARCSPANTLAFGVLTFDRNVTKGDNLLSYRNPSAFFACADSGARHEIDLQHLETPQWWFDMFKLDLSRQAYALDKVPRLSFGSTFQSPVHTESSVELGDITLNGRDVRYLYFLAIFLVIAWGGFGLWFFRQHAQALIANVKDKRDKDLPLVAYQKLSLEPHKDKEKSAVLRYLATNYANAALDLEALASQTGVNRNKVNDILKAELGFTFSGYLNKLRLTEAARLLAEKESASVAEIAYSVGYANVSYFNKLFKEEYQCTPKAFRSLSGL